MGRCMTVQQDTGIRSCFEAVLSFRSIIPDTDMASDAGYISIIGTVVGQIHAVRFFRIIRQGIGRGYR